MRTPVFCLAAALLAAVVAWVLLVRGPLRDRVRLEQALRSGPVTVRWDVGTAVAGAKLTRSLRILNDTDKDANILAGRSSCHCLTVSEKSITIPRHTTRRLTLALDTTGLQGSRTFSSSVQIGPERVDAILLTVSVNVMPDADAAVVKMASRTHDFGVVNKDAKCLHQFPVANVGRQPLHLGSARSTCGGCVAVTVERKDIPPGGNGAIAVSLDTAGHHGGLVQDVYVETNDPYDPLLRLEVRAKVRSAWVSSAEINFGTVLDDTTVSRSEYILVSGCDAGAITAASCDDPHVKLTVEPCGIEKKTADVVDKAFRVTVLFDSSGCSAGLVTSCASFGTNVPGHEKLAIWIRAYVTGSILASPSQLSFGLVAADQAVARTCMLSVPETLRSRQMDLRVVSDRPELSAKVATDGAMGNQIRLEATLRGGHAFGAISGEIHGSIAGNRVLSIPYVALVKNSPSPAH